MQALDATKIAKLLSTVPTQHRSWLRTIIGATRYYTTEEMIDMVRMVLVRLNQTLPQYHLYVPRDRIGSTHLLLLSCADLLQPVSIINGPYADHIQDRLPIVFIDDAIYSSHSACWHIEALRKSNPHLTNTFYCVVSVTSSSLPEVCKLGAIVAAHTNLSLATLDFLFDEQAEQVMAAFGCESACVLPIYFSHKIANEFGSYQFYHQLIRHPVDRSAIDKLQWSDVEAFIRSKQS